MNNINNLIDMLNFLQDNSCHIIFNDDFVKPNYYEIAFTNTVSESLPILSIDDGECILETGIVYLTPEQQRLVVDFIYNTNPATLYNLL